MFERSQTINALCSEVKQTTLAMAKSSDDKFEPSNFLFPTGIIGGKVLISGTLTEIEEIESAYRLRIADPSGSISMYIGQYQPEILSRIHSLKVPSFVTIIGKISHYENSEGTKYISIRPSKLLTVSKETRDDNMVGIVRDTIERIIFAKKNPKDSTVEMAQNIYSNFSAKSLIEDCFHAINSTGEIKEETVNKPEQTKPETKEQPKITEKPVKEKAKSKKGSAPLHTSIFDILSKYGKLSIKGVCNYLEDWDIKYDIDSVEKAIKRLMDEGMVYEPHRGFLEAVTEVKT